MLDYKIRRCDSVFFEACYPTGGNLRKFDLCPLFGPPVQHYHEVGYDYLEFKGISDKGYSVSDSHLCKFYISGLAREMLIEPILNVGQAPAYPFAIKDAETGEVLLRVREYEE